VGLQGDERDERTDWVVSTANWLHRPKRIALYDQTAAVVRERWLSYDTLAYGVLGTRGLLTREEARYTGAIGSIGNPIVIHTYDSYGHRLTTRDPRQCETTVVYEATQQYPESVRTCLQHTTRFVFDERWGTKLQETDPNLQVTTFTYDVFGRLTKVTGPLDTASQYGTVSYQYLDWGNPALQRVKVLRTEQHGTANVVWSEQYFDGLGRIDKETAEGPGGQVIQANIVFDARGLIDARTAPYFSTETPAWTQFTYDAVGRPVRVDHPDNTFATTAYAPGLVTMTDQRGKVTRRFTDAHGRVTRVEEVNDSATYGTTYAYDAADQLERVTDHLGHVTEMEYDLLGRKFTTLDPNMGSWSYTYDLTGNLLTQTDAKQQTHLHL
jgi:YD repeat-containing protein